MEQGGRPRLALLALGVGALVLFVGGGARFAISLTLKEIDAEFAGGRSLVGLAVLAFQLVSAVAMLVAGRLADRHDLRHVLAGGVLVAAAGLAGMSLVASPLQLVLLYGVVFALGTGVASLIPVGVLVTRAVPDRVGTANAIVLTGMGLGQLVMMAIFSALLADIGWRQVYLVLGLIHVVLIPAVLLGIGRRAAAPVQGSSVVMRADEAVSSQEASGLGLGEAARTGRFWLLLAVYALCGFEDFFVSTHIVAFAQDRGANVLLAGNLLAAMGLMMLIGVLAAGWASDRTGPVLPTLVSFLVRVAIFAAVLVDQSTVTVALFALLFGGTFLVTAPLCVVFARQAFGTRNLGLITGLITMVHHVAGGLGAWIGAAWFDAAGNYDGVLVGMLLTSVAGAGLTLLLRQGGR